MYIKLYKCRLCGKEILQDCFEEEKNIEINLLNLNKKDMFVEHRCDGNRIGLAELSGYLLKHD